MTSPTILIIDDQPDNLAVFAAVLGEHLPDTNILCAGGADEAFDVIEEHPPDAILLDVQMPGTNGIAMCRKLKAGPATAHIPVLLITAQKSDGHDRARGLDAGADDFLNKPVDNAELVARVRVALRIKHAEDRLRQSSATQQLRAEISDEQNRTILQTATEGYCLVDPNGRLLDVNEAYCLMSGYSRKELLTMSIPQLEAVESPEDILAHLARVKAEGPARFESRHRRKDGSLYDVEVSSKYVLLGGKERIVALLRDITERKHAEREREVTIEILRLINGCNHTHELIQAVTRYLQEWAGCQAVGIRLKEGDDYPYFETRGFPPEFVAAENRLCARDLKGQLLRDQTGNPVIECMCGNVIRGRTDPSKPFFTEHGSFWSNGTTELLASTTEADRQARTRNRCNGEGYESVALIPLRYGNQALGLIQLNDRRMDRFTPEFIAQMERMADSLAMALSQRKAEQALRESEIKYRTVADFTYDWELWRGPAGEIRYCSPSCERVAGYRAEEFLADPDLIVRMVHADDRAAMRAHLAEAENSITGVLRLEFRIITRQCETRWISHVCAPAHSADGAFLGRRASNRDITDRKQAEEALRESERFARATVDALSEHIAVLDETGTIIAVNRAWRAFAAANLPLSSNASEGSNYLAVCDLATGSDAAAARAMAEGIRAVIAGAQDTFELEYPCHSPEVQRWFICRVHRFLGPGVTRLVVSHENITQRKIAEQALHESEARYQRLTQAVTDYIYTVSVSEDGQAGATVHGYGCEAVTGYCPEAFAAQPYLWIEMVVPEDRAQVKACAQRLLAGEAVAPYEHRILRKDGSVRWVRNTPSLHIDSSGRLLSYDGLVSDITERKQAEDELRHSGEQLSLALEGAELGTWDWYVQTGEAEFNERWAKMLGYELAEIEPHVRVWENLIHPDDRSQVMSLLEAHLAGHTRSYESEHRLRHKSGDWVWVLDKGKVIERDTEGAPVRAVGTHLDITIRKRAADALEESRQRLALAADAARLGIWDWDIINNKMLWDDQMFRLYGITEKPAAYGVEIWNKGIHPDDRAFAMDECQAALRGERPFDNEFRVKHPDGSVRHLKANGLVLRDPDGKPIRMLGVNYDITERHRLEQQYQTLFREMLDGFALHEIILDAHGHPVDYRFLDVNPAFEQQTGLKAEAIIGKTVLDVMPNTERHWIETYGRVALTGEPAHFENYAAEIGKYFEVTAFRPAPHQFACMFVDVTERRNAERALRESEVRFRQVLDATPFPTAVADTNDDTIHYWSRSALELFGHTAPTTSEWYALAYPDPDYRRDVIERWKPFLETARQSGRAVNTGEYRVTCKDGSVLICELHAQFVADYLIVTFNDITERKKAENAVRESERQLSLITNTIPNSIWAGRPDGYIDFVNRTWLNYTGMMLEQVQGNGWMAALHPDDVKPIGQAWASACHRGDHFEVEERLRGADGVFRWFLAQARPVKDGTGKIVRWYGTNTDITAQKTASERAQLRTEVLALLNGPTLDAEGMRQLLELIQKHTGADGAALRLRKEDDFPYVYTLGLSGEFIQAESALCTYDAEGEAVRDRSGRVAMACLCGVVLRGKVPKDACFTRHGSFHCGDLKALVETQPDWLANLHPRGRCLVEGYSSMALIPIRSSGETVGLLQLSYRRTDGFGAGEVEFLEELSESLGVAIARYEAESALRTSEERYRALVNDSPVAILVQTQDGIQYANPAALKLLRIDSPISLLGRSLIDLTHTDERGMVSDLLGQTAQEVNPGSTVAIRLLLQDGTMAYVEAQAIPMSFGGRAAVQIMATDITARRQAETARLLSEERFRRIFESSPMGVALAKRDDERFVRVNQRYCQITGYSHKELEAMSIAQLTHPDDRPLDDRRNRALSQGDSPFHTYEKRYLRKDGASVWVRVTVTAMRDERGEPSLSLSLVEDISENRQLEEQLRQAQKMESLGQLAGGVAHDFNNQLSVIVGYAELIEGRVSNPDLKSGARQVLNAAIKSAELTRQLLAFARRGEFKAKPVDVRAIVKETIAVLKRTIHKKIEVTGTIAEGPAMVVGDASLLSNALFNLAINARDAMPDGGAIRFIIEQARLGLEQVNALGEDLKPGLYLRLRIQDTGQGMPQETRLRIFEPFFTTKGEGKGTGLGLAAVYGTIKRHHGAIGVESEVGRGSTFTLYLPIAGGEEQIERPDVGPLPDVRAVRILSVDDEESLSMMLQTMLEREGCEVTLYHDGRAAVEYYKENAAKVDVVILDMNMPKMDGLETMVALRKIEPKVKVLIATGHSDDAELRAVRELGALDVVAKPFGRDELVRAIGRAVGR